MHTSNAIAVLDRMDHNQKKLEELTLELRRSVTLSQLFGNHIWDRGAVSSQVTGNANVAMSFALFYGSKVITVDLLDVPIVLWPERVKHDIMSIYGLQSPYLTQLKKRLREAS